MHGQKNRGKELRCKKHIQWEYVGKIQTEARLD